MNDGLAACLGMLVGRLDHEAVSDPHIEKALVWIHHKVGAVNSGKYQPSFDRGVAHGQRHQAEAAARQHKVLPTSIPRMPDVSGKIRQTK